jgi:NAD(P)-dependent dehydrogenase (short-subunit alcohol dehydrogenase family)
MDKTLKGKVAIITGSEGSIGKELVKAFRARGARVFGFDIKRGDDITIQSTMEKRIIDIYKKTKRVDILINNAGATYPDDLIETAWDKTIDVNLKAPAMLSRFIAGGMTNGGSIINITSLWSERGFPNNLAYGASKGGLKALTKCLAYDLAKNNIRVNNVGLGYIKTNMTRGGWKYNRELIKDCTLLKRWGTPKDVTGLIVFLCTDEAKYITGQDFYIDGGWLAKGI